MFCSFSLALSLFKIIFANIKACRSFNSNKILAIYYGKYKSFSAFAFCCICQLSLCHIASSESTMQWCSNQVEVIFFSLSHLNICFVWMPFKHSLVKNVATEFMESLISESVVGERDFRKPDWLDGLNRWMDRLQEEWGDQWIGALFIW